MYMRVWIYKCNLIGCSIYMRVWIYKCNLIGFLFCMRVWIYKCNLIGCSIYMWARISKCYLIECLLWMRVQIYKCNLIELCNTQFKFIERHTAHNSDITQDHTTRVAYYIIRKSRKLHNTWLAQNTSRTTKVSHSTLVTHHSAKSIPNRDGNWSMKANGLQ